MYLWKTDELVKDFSNNRVSEYEQFKYILLYSLLTALAFDTYLPSETTYNINDFISTACFLIITFWGVRLCYKTNKRNDDTDFIARFICVGLPVVVKISVILIPIYFIIGMIGYYFGIGLLYDESGMEINTSSVIDVGFTIIFGVSYYKYLSNKLCLIKTKT